ncbi:diguanylate cyclase [Novosphingobium sp. Gsoil 351]|uniref:diguanylate cyclase n=1 Tax=Novosphingobium sp. Gsoil 351 TaxID=2675225 RepID=UPI0012B502D4|nr:diguanylate cyclase [Novosphingobium sp. Gsoil 351]QGN55739.1 diguanylate cyclase [Novosphingobium sp. Gsoil 351]
MLHVPAKALTQVSAIDVARATEFDFADLWTTIAAITGNSPDTLTLILPDALYREGQGLYKFEDWITLWADESKAFAVEALARVDVAGSAKATLETRDANGSRAFWEVALSQIKGHEAVLSVARDITERMSHEVQLRRVAYHDGLTGLLNRAALKEQLAEDICAATVHGGSVTVLMLDLDNFKLINDTLGHDAGDAVPGRDRGTASCDRITGKCGRAIGR